MSDYLIWNKFIGPIQEMAIKKIRKKYDRAKLRHELLRAGIPFVHKLIGCMESPIEEIRWPRTRDLLLDGATYTLWKAIFGSSFRPVFVEILYQIVLHIKLEDLEPYRKNPKDWKINHYASVKRGLYRQGRVKP